MDRSPKGLWERQDQAFPKVQTVGQKCNQPPPEAAPRARGKQGGRAGIQPVGPWGGLDSRRDVSTQPLPLDLPWCRASRPSTNWLHGAQSYRQSGREPPFSPNAEPGVGTAREWANPYDTCSTPLAFSVDASFW